jgi:hypothetical protein
MNDYLDSLKVPPQQGIKGDNDEQREETIREETLRIIKDVLNVERNSTELLIQQKIRKMCVEKGYELSDDEITATGVLAEEFGKYVILSIDYFDEMVPEKERMMKLIYDGNDFIDKGIATMIGAMIHDMTECRKYTLTRGPWEFHIRRIFQYLDGKNPYKIYADIEPQARAALAASSQPELKIVGRETNG